MSAVKNIYQNKKVSEILILILNVVIIPISLIGLNLYVYLMQIVQYQEDNKSIYFPFLTSPGASYPSPKYSNSWFSYFLYIMAIQLMVIFVAGVLQDKSKMKYLNFKYISYGLLIFLFILGLLFNYN